MNQNEKEEKVRNVSKDALKGIYYVIIGIAITEALNRTFIKELNFLGLHVFLDNNLNTTLLLFAFLPTICRFVHGASIHLGVKVEKRYKLLVDFIGFFLQASFFYLMAISITEPISFAFLLIFMLSSDTGWLIFLKLIKYIKWDKTVIQWFISNLLFIGILISLIMFASLILESFISFIIIIAAYISAFLDYYLNRDFYFPATK